MTYAQFTKTMAIEGLIFLADWLESREQANTVLYFEAQREIGERTQ